MINVRTTRIKILSLWNPWALFVIMGLKRFETRHWKDPYRGVLGIHAAKRWTEAERRLYREFALSMGLDISAHTLWGKLWRHDPRYFGALLGTVRLIDIYPTEQMIHMTAQERMLGNYDPNRFAWKLVDPVVFANPILMIGHQKMWTWDMPDGIKVL